MVNTVYYLKLSNLPSFFNDSIKMYIKIYFKFEIKFEILNINVSEIEK